MRLWAGLCSVTFRKLPADDVLGLAADAHLEAIEWGADIHVTPTMPATDVRGLAERTRSAGLACASYGSYLTAGKSRRDDAGPVFDTAVALGATNVRVWCPYGSPPGSDRDLRSRCTDDLAAWANAAASADLTVSLEFHVATFTETAESAQAMLDDAGRPPNLFTYWQPVVGRAPLDEVTAILDDLSHLHVFRWNDDGSRLPLSDGDDIWPAVVATVAASPPTRWSAPRCAFLEFVRDDDPAQFARDAATLRAWLAG